MLYTMIDIELTAEFDSFRVLGFFFLQLSTFSTYMEKQQGEVPNHITAQRTPSLVSRST